MAGNLPQYVSIAANRLKPPLLPQTPYVNQALLTASLTHQIVDVEAAIRERERQLAALHQQQLAGLLSTYHGMLGAGGPLDFGALIQIAQQIQSTAKPGSQVSPLLGPQFGAGMGAMGTLPGLGLGLTGLQPDLPVRLSTLGNLVRNPGPPNNRTNLGDPVTALFTLKRTAKMYFLIRTRTAPVLSSYAAMLAPIKLGTQSGGFLPQPLDIRVNGQPIGLEAIDGYMYFGDKSGEIWAAKSPASLPPA